MAGVFCSRRQGCWNERTGENRKLCVCARAHSECEEAEGSGRHRAGSSWGIQQRPACLRDRMHPPWVSCPLVEKARPSWKSLSPCSPHLYLSVPLPTAACRAGPCGKVPTLQSPFNSSNPRHSSLGCLPHLSPRAVPAAPCSGSGGET